MRAPREIAPKYNETYRFNYRSRAGLCGIAPKHNETYRFNYWSRAGLGTHRPIVYTRPAHFKAY